ncbi:50S ribosomal protein L25 [Pseudochrobactrum sp. MP213Fo]
MSETKVLKAVKRDRAGKGSSRIIRNNGQIPAVIYGDKQPVISIAVDYKTIYYLIYGGGFKSTTFMIEVDGQNIKVQPKDYQMDRVKDTPLHVDFIRVA